MIPEDELKLADVKINEILLRISTEAKKIKYPNQPWLEPPEIQAYDSVSLGQILDECGVARLSRKLLDLTFENDNLSSVYKQSWLDILCHIKGSTQHCQTEDYWDLLELFRCGNGNMSLAEKLVENIDIEYHQPVTKIHQTQSGRIHLPRQKGNIRLISLC